MSPEKLGLLLKYLTKLELLEFTLWLYKYASINVRDEQIMEKISEILRR